MSGVVPASAEVAFEVGRDIDRAIEAAMPPGWGYVFVVAPHCRQNGEAMNHVWSTGGEGRLPDFLRSLADRLDEEAL